jgi:hypothetical protein
MQVSLALTLFPDEFPFRCARVSDSKESQRSVAIIVFHRNIEFDSLHQKQLVMRYSYLPQSISIPLRDMLTTLKLFQKSATELP